MGGRGLWRGGLSAAVVHSERSAILRRRGGCGVVSVAVNALARYTSPSYHPLLNRVPLTTIRPLLVVVQSAGIHSSSLLAAAKSRKKMPPKKGAQEEKLLLGRPSNNLKIGVVGLPNVG
jgi:hypothetical protein